MLSAVDGVSMTDEERAIIGVGAGSLRRHVGRLQMLTPRRQEYGKLSCVGS
jgi:hypothetical protein